MEQHYKFNHKEFNDDGINPKDGRLFTDLIREWEVDFHNRYFPFFSNCLLANGSMMILMKNCFITEPNEDLGMELINGKIDLDTNLEIEDHSNRQTIFAIESMNDEDEPLYFVRDDTMSDGILFLKYVPDFDDDDEIFSPPVPSETKIINKR